MSASGDMILRSVTSLYVWHCSLMAKSKSPLIWRSHTHIEREREEDRCKYKLFHPPQHLLSCPPLGWVPQHSSSRRLNPTDGHNPPTTDYKLSQGRKADFMWVDRQSETLNKRSRTDLLRLHVTSSHHLRVHHLPPTITVGVAVDIIRLDSSGRNKNLSKEIWKKEWNVTVTSQGSSPLVARRHQILSKE